MSKISVKKLLVSALFFLIYSKSVFAYQEQIYLSKNVLGQPILLLSGLAYSNCGIPVQNTVVINPIDKTFYFTAISEILVIPAPLYFYAFPAYDYGGPPCSPSLNLQPYRYELVLPSNLSGVYTFQFKPLFEPQIVKSFDLQSIWTVPVNNGIWATILVLLFLAMHKLRSITRSSI
jgi:hypothetical protein